MKKKITTQQINPKSPIKKMLPGALIGLVIISLFLFSVEEPNPIWGKQWMIKPLIIVPLSGALGSLFFYSMKLLRSQNKWKNVLTILLSLIVFVIILWLGIVLGLDGTLWN